MSPFTGIRSWYARRSHRQRVKKLRKAELKLAGIEARQKRVELLQATYQAHGSWGSVNSRDQVVELAGEVAVLKKHIEHLRHDVFEGAS